MLAQINGYNVSNPNQNRQISFGKDWSKVKQEVAPVVKKGVSAVVNKAKQGPASLAKIDIIEILKLNEQMQKGAKVNISPRVSEALQNMTGEKNVTPAVVEACAEHLKAMDPVVKSVSEAVSNNLKSGSSLSDDFIAKTKIKMSSFMDGPIRVGHVKVVAKKAVPVAKEVAPATHQMEFFMQKESMKAVLNKLKQLKSPDLHPVSIPSAANELGAKKLHHVIA